MSVSTDKYALEYKLDSSIMKITCSLVVKLLSLLFIIQNKQQNKDSLHAMCLRVLIQYIVYSTKYTD